MIVPVIESTFTLKNLVKSHVHSLCKCFNWFMINEKLITTDTDCKRKSFPSEIGPDGYQ